MISRRRVAVAFTVVVLGAATVTTAVQAGEGDGRRFGPGDVTIELRIEHSRFQPSWVAVRPGTTVRFRVVNDDPIGHELIVGGPEVHARHATGTEADHPPVAGEVSVGPLATAGTSFTFDEPGRVVFACHLPGHLEYGMRGTVDVAN